MEDKEPKKINDDLITFMKKRSDSEVPRYSERLKNYVTIQQRRAAAAKRVHERRPSRKSRDAENRDADAANTEHPGNDDDSTGRGLRRGRAKDTTHSDGRTRTRSGSASASISGDPQERCGRRRRRRRRRRRSRCKRRRSCRRRRRRRRRCSRRRRRRSCSRRRRRRSCRRRRRRRRRC